MKNIKEERWTSWLVKEIRKHKVFSMAIIVLILFSIINCAMIYQFMKILQNI